MIYGHGICGVQIYTFQLELPDSRRINIIIRNGKSNCVKYAPITGTVSFEHSPARLYCVAFGGCAERQLSHQASQEIADFIVATYLNKRPVCPNVFTSAQWCSTNCQHPVYTYSELPRYVACRMFSKANEKDQQKSWKNKKGTNQGLFHRKLIFLISVSPTGWIHYTMTVSRTGRTKKNQQGAEKRLLCPNNQPRQHVAKSFASSDRCSCHRRHCIYLTVTNHSQHKPFHHYTVGQLHN